MIRLRAHANASDSDSTAAVLMLVSGACARMKRCICGETPHCGCTRAHGALVRRAETSHLSTCMPSVSLRYSHTSLKSSLAALSACFSASDCSPRSTFSLAASMTSSSSKVPTPCSAISSIWSSAKSTSNPWLLRRSSTGEEEAAALVAPET